MKRLFFMDEGELHAIELADWEGVPCLRVGYSEVGSSQEVEAFVDSSTMNPIAQLERFADGRVRKVLFGDYRSLGGMQEPFWV